MYDANLKSNYLKEIVDIWSNFKLLSDFNPYHKQVLRVKISKKKNESQEIFEGKLSAS